MLVDEDVKAIEALNDEWVRREIAGESHSLRELCTDGVVVMPPGQPPVVGRAAVSQWFARQGPEIVSITVEISLVHGDAIRAYKLANFESELTDSSGNPQVVTGIHFWVLERNTFGEWAVAFVTWHVYA